MNRSRILDALPGKLQDYYFGRIHEIKTVRNFDGAKGALVSVSFKSELAVSEKWRYEGTIGSRRWVLQ